MRRARSWLLALLLALAGSPAVAVEPGEMLKDPGQEERARELGREIRCLVCQSQSIEDSAADLARDLRHIVRERIEAGDSDNQIRAFLVARYGDFVLFNPPVKPATYVLWFGPVIVFFVASTAVLVYLRRRRRAASDTASTPAALTAEEERRLERLLAEGGGPDRPA
jgi:cytochrome c-type biogenesis protein CcmH